MPWLRKVREKAFGRILQKSQEIFRGKKKTKTRKRS